MILLRANAVHQAGVIPFRLKSGRVEIMLVTSKKRKRWIIPKGNVEKELGVVASARLEAFEEAGVYGPINPDSVGVYEHGCPPQHLVKVFLMSVERVLDCWPEDGERVRRWVELPEAPAFVEEDGLQRLFSKAHRMVHPFARVPVRIPRMELRERRSEFNGAVNPVRNEPASLTG